MPYKTIFNRKTINIKEKYSNMPRKKKKAYKKFLNSVKRLGWSRENIDDFYVQYPNVL